MKICVCAQSLSYVQLCKPMDCSLTGSSVHGIFQARILEWVAISFSRGSSRPWDQTHVSCASPALQADSLPLGHQGSPDESSEAGIVSGTCQEQQLIIY